jgi:hypothetical protein
MIAAPPTFVAPPPPVWKAPPPPAPVIPVLAPSEAPRSALEASNVAARKSELPPAPARLDSATASPATVTVTEMVWLDASLGPRLDKHPALSRYKRALPAEEALRAQVYDALTKGTIAGGREIEAALTAAEGESPLVVTGGELEIGLDEAAWLEAVVRAASPLAGGDKKLKEAIEAATEMLKAPLSGMPDIAESLAARVREAWAKANRSLPATYLEAAAERTLLEQRRYQVREILDDTWIRAVLGGAAFEGSVVVYLPAKIGKRLPLFRRFEARILAEVMLPQDQGETGTVALKVAALGRVARRAK